MVYYAVLQIQSVLYLVVAEVGVGGGALAWGQLILLYRWTDAGALQLPGACHGNKTHQ